MQISPSDTYTARFNRRHKLFGHLFSVRYKSLVVDAASPGYRRTVCKYVHLNPVRAKLLRPEAPLRAYRWSSYPGYLERPGRRPAWLRACLPAGRWSGCSASWGFQRTVRREALRAAGTCG